MRVFRSLVAFGSLLAFMSSGGCTPHYGAPTMRSSVTSTPNGVFTDVRIDDWVAMAMPRAPNRELEELARNDVKLTMAKLTSVDPESVDDPVAVVLVYSVLASPGPAVSADKAQKLVQSWADDFRGKPITVQRQKNAQRGDSHRFEAHWTATANNDFSHAAFPTEGYAVAYADKNRVLFLIAFRRSDRPETGRLAEIVSSLDIR